jgi:Mg2+/Co2+ transporter CorB
MKLFGINFGSSSAANLNPDQMVLKLKLIPLFGALRTAGYSIKEAGAALRNHFDRTKELITADRIKELLQDPETLISTFRTFNNRANLLTKPQIAALKITFAKPEDRAEAQAFLIGQFVADAIPRIVFKEILQQLLASGFSPAQAQIAQWRKRLPQR